MSAVNSASLLGLKSLEEYNKERKPSKEDMGKQEFLTLFTAQLKNQNPLDPVKNEAFVAQLAQFSQLEALTNMQGSLDTFVQSMSSERILSSAALIGKKVAVEGAFGFVDENFGLEGKLNLPQGADGVKVNIFDQRGAMVAELIAGPQMPGLAPIYWDGTDALGNPVPAGSYRMQAQAVVEGNTETMPVSVMTLVRSISSNPADGNITLEVEGGRSVLLADVKNIGL
jgi:flagellar basal-body rod modification protein FlgD